MVYRHVIPRPPNSHYATPTNSSYNMYACVYTCRLHYYAQKVGCGVSPRVDNNKQRIVKLAQTTDSRFTNRGTKSDCVVYKQQDTWILGGNYESNTRRKVCKWHVASAE